MLNIKHYCKKFLHSTHYNAFIAQCQVYFNLHSNPTKPMKIRSLLLTGLMIVSSMVLLAQQKTITGTITSEKSGETMPGATVVIKGTTTGVASDLNGKYSIQAATGDVLVVSFIGMKDKEINIGDASVYNVKLASGVDLDEYVVTALGISREKRALGYAVSNVSGEDLDRSGEQNVIQALAAKVPGIQVTGSAGTPGASSKILIRGPSTFTGENQPLIVIDGVPIDNSTTQSSPRDYPFNANLQGVNNSNRAIDINPNDIESVTILKGPAAAALYGARAGNGAIIYTTKRGKMGAKGIGVKISSSIELSTVNKLPEFQEKYNLGDFDTDVNDFVNIPFADPGPDELYGTADDPGDYGTQTSWGRPISETGDEIFDNTDNFYQTGVSYNNNIEVSGGTENSAFRLSIGDQRTEGVVPNTNFDRTSVRLNADHNINDKISLSGSANYIRSTSTMAQNGSNLSGVSLSLFRMPATFDVRNYRTERFGYNNTYNVAYDNPLYSVYENPFTSNVDRFVGNFGVNVKLTNEFTVSYRLGVDAYADNRKQIFAVSSNNDDIGQVGQVNINALKSRQAYGDLLLGYNKKLNEKMNLNVQLGHNFFVKQFDDQFGRGRILGIPNFYNLANASDLYSSQYTENLNTFALFGNIEFDYDRWFYVNFTGRNEWASSFELSNNNFFYPSASTSIVFTELFDGLPDWISFGKVRYSYAQVGIPPVPYNTRTYYSTPTYTDGFTNGLSFPYGEINGYGISDDLGNTDLRPEILVGNEVGIAMSFFEDLFNFDITYYNQKSKDVLLFRPLAQSSGYSSQYTNAAEMVNKGLEIQVGINPFRKGDFSWAVDMNWAANRNEVTKLTEGVEEVTLEAAFASIGSFAIVGEPIGVFYGTRWLRDGAGNVIVGEDGIPIFDPQTGNVGSWIPDWTAGLRNTFTYKGVTLSFLFDFRKGGDIWNGTKARLNSIGRSADSEDRERTYIYEGVTETGEVNVTPISAYDYFQAVVGDFGGASEEFVETVNWARLRDLSVGYTFNFGENASVRSINLSVTARNLWLSTNYTGVDPETSLTGAGSNLNGFDYFNNPGTKSIRFGAALSF